MISKFISTKEKDKAIKTVTVFWCSHKIELKPKSFVFLKRISLGLLYFRRFITFPWNFVKTDIHCLNSALLNKRQQEILLKCIAWAKSLEFWKWKIYQRSNMVLEETTLFLYQKLINWNRLKGLQSTSLLQVIIVNSSIRWRVDRCNASAGLLIQNRSFFFLINTFSRDGKRKRIHYS